MRCYRCPTYQTDTFLKTICYSDDKVRSLNFLPPITKCLECFGRINSLCRKSPTRQTSIPLCAKFGDFFKNGFKSLRRKSRNRKEQKSIFSLFGYFSFANNYFIHSEVAGRFLTQKHIFSLDTLAAYLDDDSEVSPFP